MSAKETVSIGLSAAILSVEGERPSVLVVAHGALFRSLRAAMGIEPNMRTQNAVPIFCEPGAAGWTLSPVV